MPRHGDGVRDIAFRVPDVFASWRETTARGARSAIEPVELDAGEDGVLRRSAVWTYGDVRHSFIDRRDYHGAFLPGYRRVKKPARPGPFTTSSAWPSPSTSAREIPASSSRTPAGTPSSVRGAVPGHNDAFVTIRKTNKV